MKFSIPEKGLSKEEVLKQLEQFRDEDINYRDGKTWSLVYQLSDEHTEFLKEAYNTYFSENALNPMAFKSLKNMEHEVVRMALDLLNGPEDSVGTMSSGGTESILLAVKTYRDLFRFKNKGLFKRKRNELPEMIVPKSVHIAFNKAASYFDVKLVYAPLDENKRVDVAAV